MALPPRAHRTLALLAQHKQGMFIPDVSRLYRIGIVRLLADFDQLHKAHLITEEWAEGPSPRSRIYTVTAAGRNYLADKPAPAGRPRSAFLLLSVVFTLWSIGGTAVALRDDPQATLGQCITIFTAGSLWIVWYAGRRRYDHRSLLAAASYYLAGNIALAIWALTSSSGWLPIIIMAAVAALLIATLHIGGWGIARPEPPAWRPRFWYVPQTGRINIHSLDVTLDGISQRRLDSDGTDLVMDPAAARHRAAQLLFAADFCDRMRQQAGWVHREQPALFDDLAEEIQREATADQRAASPRD